MPGVCIPDNRKKRSNPLNRDIGTAMSPDRPMGRSLDRPGRPCVMAFSPPGDVSARPEVTLRDDH